MNLPCELVRDLLPLYHDGVCSGVSKEIVEEHLEGCQDCRAELQKLDAPLEVSATPAEAEEALASVKKRWNKGRRRAFLLGLAITAVVAPLLIYVLATWDCIPIDPREIVIMEHSVMEDGTTVLGTQVLYSSYESYFYVTEDGVSYEYFRRPILSKRLDPERSGWQVSYSRPEEEVRHTTKTHTLVEIQAMYFGKPGAKNAVLLWEKGMELPTTQESYVSYYQDYLLSFNQPEDADPNPEPTCVSGDSTEPTRAN